MPLNLTRFGVLYSLRRWKIDHQMHTSRVQSAPRTGLFFCSAFVSLSRSITGQPTSALFPRLRALVGIAPSAKELSIEPAPVRSKLLVRGPAGGASQLPCSVC